MTVRIDARQISLCYATRLGESVSALGPLDFSLAPGEMTGVLGPSGSGKSSLLYVLSGLKRPTAGAVFYDECDISGWSAEQLEDFRRRYFGFIFQRHYLVSHLTILENILLPVGNAAPEDVEKAARLMERLHICLPPGRMPDELSVGQRQLVAVARALMNDPAVIFADEPTASLDMDTALSVMDTLGECLPGASLIVVTHDLKMLRHAGAIVKLRDGRKI